MTRSATSIYLRLVGQITCANNGTRMMTTKQYGILNRLTSISCVPSVSLAAPQQGGGGSVVTSSYQYNLASQRTAATNADGSYWLYGYDPLGQVTAGEQFQYGFDTIGNRTTTDAGGDQNDQNLRQATYTANNLNQYTVRDVPDYAEISGSAAANATVSLWSLGGAHTTPYRKGSSFWGELALTNSQRPVWAQITNLAALQSGSSQIVTSATGAVFLAQTPEHFTYDLDGNLQTDGHWTYTWDGANRLIGMTNAAATAPAVGLAFDDDWQGRRIQKLVWYNATSTNSSVFLYDGWNLLGIYNSSFILHPFFLWGLDLSGSLQGAGGVGGLLAVDDTANGSHFAAFDGNGNILGLVSATSDAEVYGGDPVIVNGAVIATPLARTGAIGSEMVAGGRWLDILVGPKGIQPTSLVCEALL